MRRWLVGLALWGMAAGMARADTWFRHDLPMGGSEWLQVTRTGEKFTGVWFRYRVDPGGRVTLNAGPAGGKVAGGRWIINTGHWEKRGLEKEQFVADEAFSGWKGRPLLKMAQWVPADRLNAFLFVPAPAPDFWTEQSPLLKDSMARMAAHMQKDLAR